MEFRRRTNEMKVSREWKQQIGVNTGAANAEI
jgi:hypothetical protein